MTDPEVASKCLIATIPVWLIRDEAAIQKGIKIKRIAESLVPPSKDIVVDEWCDEGTGLIRPYPTLHEGVSGVARHLAARRMGCAYSDLVLLDQPQITPSSGKIASGSKASPMASNMPCTFCCNKLVCLTKLFIFKICIPHVMLPATSLNEPRDLKIEALYQLSRHQTKVLQQLRIIINGLMLILL